MKWFFTILCLLVVVSLATAQEGGSLDWDIDSIFDEPLPEAAPKSPGDSPPEASKDTAEPAHGVSGRPDLVRRQGVSFDGSYEFNVGFAPGWEVAPWFSPEEDESRGFSWFPGAKMKVRFDVDAQISDIFRVISSIYFEIPGLDLTLGDFFFDYSLYNRVFIRGGKYNHAWGISPNFAFANLLARVPDESYNRDPFIVKADIPFGIGGIQFLVMTRVDLMGGDTPDRRDMGYGAKFNLALRRLDMDIGAFYQENMPLRGFLSFKTTIGNTEWYNEWLGVVDVPYPDFSGAVNVGFIRDLFRNRVTVNGEVFYNSEQESFSYRPETNLTDPETYLFVEGLNVAMNILWRIGGKGNPRLFFQTLYAPMQESAQLVPGFRLSPWNHIEFYLAVPMGLGPKSGYYYSHTVDPMIPHRPFSIVFLVTLKGNVKIGQYH